MFELAFNEGYNSYVKINYPGFHLKAVNKRYELDTDNCT